MPLSGKIQSIEELEPHDFLLNGLGALRAGTFPLQFLDGGR